MEGEVEFRGREACAVANASGAEVDARRFRRFLKSSPPGMRSSMQKDVAAGRQLELDAIGGPIVRGGERHGIGVSTTTELMAAIRAKVGSTSLRRGLPLNPFGAVALPTRGPGAIRATLIACYTLSPMKTLRLLLNPGIAWWRADRTRRFAQAAASPTASQLAMPEEKHLRNVRQLTFGGSNAEAYFSADGKRLIFQSTRDNLQCDQIFTMNVDGTDQKMVSTGKGRTTCSYIFRTTTRFCIPRRTWRVRIARRVRIIRRAMCGRSIRGLIFSRRSWMDRT
jgi:hypothetical protein